MRRRALAVVSAAATAAALGFSGCSKDEQDASTPQTASTPPSGQAPPNPSVSPQGAPLPPPDALAGVLYRLADPAVPGAQKLNLVEGATTENGAVFDQFATALVNGGYAPVKFDVRDVAWSDRDPANVVANVNAGSTDPHGPRFSFPMEFTPFQGGWQLSARTADALLALHTDTASPAPASTPGH